jgi:hypothetical protein
MPSPVFQESQTFADTRARTSRAIGLARVLCILGIVYVHAWTGLYGPALSALDHTPQGLLRWGLIELLARSSVPLLSLVSGWLVGPSLARRGARAFLAGKARTVLVPMLAWNAIAIVVVSGAAWLGWLYAPQPTSWGWLANELTGFVHPNEINVQMPFLRDLFLCLLMAPLLVRQGDRTLAVVAVAAWPGAWRRRSSRCCSAPRSWASSCWACWCAAMMPPRGLRAAGVDRDALSCAVGREDLAGTVWPGAGLASPLLLACVDLAMRAATALCFWALAWRLAQTRAGEALSRLEPAMFLLFCCHLILIWCAGPAIGALTGPLGAPLYPLFLLTQPLLALGATLLLGAALRRARRWPSGSAAGG